MNSGPKMLQLHSRSLKGKVIISSLAGAGGSVDHTLALYVFPVADFLMSVQWFWGKQRMAIVGYGGTWVSATSYGYVTWIADIGLWQMWGESLKKAGYLSGFPFTLEER